MSLSTSHSHSSRVRLALAIVCAALTWPVVAQPPLPDLCGCRNHPASLGAFDIRDRNTWPPGTVQNPQNFRLISIPLPADGVLVFDSMHLEFLSSIHQSPPVELRFQRNAANTPVTILVKGNVTIAANAALIVSGDTRTSGTAGGAGVGGLGGPGGFRGGDGAFRIANLATDGGVGLGPGGGAGATSTPGRSAPGARASPGVSISCRCSVAPAGVADHRRPPSRIRRRRRRRRRWRPPDRRKRDHHGQPHGRRHHRGRRKRRSRKRIPLLQRRRGRIGRGHPADCECDRGNGRIFARNGGRWEDAVPAGDGRIRMEAVTNTFPANFTDPIASRSATPGPVVNPFNPSVTLTAVGGQPVPAAPQGVFGGVDVQVSAPGPTGFDFSTEGVPTGTSVEVKIKPRVGGAPITQNVTLANCDVEGRCLERDDRSGCRHGTIEARATFQVQDHNSGEGRRRPRLPSSFFLLPSSFFLLSSFFFLLLPSSFHRSPSVNQYAWTHRHRIPRSQSRSATHAHQLFVSATKSHLRARLIFGQFRSCRNARTFAHDSGRPIAVASRFEPVRLVRNTGLRRDGASVMRKVTCALIVFFGLLIAGASPAGAAPIKVGQFSWDDPFGLGFLDPSLTVFTFENGLNDVTNLSVVLETDQGLLDPIPYSVDGSSLVIPGAASIQIPHPLDVVVLQAFIVMAGANSIWWMRPASE